jgi:hypothetical protein
MNAACTLQSLRVRTESGRVLGHAFDLRCTPGPQAVVTHLVYGRRGLLERLGFRKERCDTIPWSRVVALRPDEIVIAMKGT